MSAIIKKNSRGFNHTFADLAATHQHLEESGQRYYQEIDVLDGVDYVVTVVIDENGKELRRSRGCRITLPTGGASGGKSNLCQEAGSALTYARRYSLWMAFGLATAADDGKAFDRPKARDKCVQVKPEPKKTEPTKHALDRTQAVNRISLLINSGRLSLEQVQATVRKYGAAKMNELSDDAFAECVATLTKSA